MASSWRRLSRHPVDQPSVSMIVEWALMWVYRVSHCPTFSVNSLWIIGVCYRGILVSVGQSHDISLWSILSLGNRSINVEMIYKLRVFDINWYLITLIIYVQTLKRLLGELTRGYDTSVEQWVSIGLDYGAAYTTHYCLNKWWHKPTMYVCVTWP